MSLDRDVRQLRRGLYDGFVPCTDLILRALWKPHTILVNVPYTGASPEHLDVYNKYPFPAWRVLPEATKSDSFPQNLADFLEDLTHEAGILAKDNWDLGKEETPYLLHVRFSAPPREIIREQQAPTGGIIGVKGFYEKSTIHIIEIKDLLAPKQLPEPQCAGVAESNEPRIIYHRGEKIRRIA